MDTYRTTKQQKEYCQHIVTKVKYEISDVCSVASANMKYRECVDCGEITEYGVNENFHESNN